MNYLEKHIIDEHKSKLNTCYDDFAREIMALQNADTFTLLFATDIHYIREYAPYVPVYKKLKQMVEFSGYVGADLLAVAGDSVDGNTTLDCQYRDLLDVVSLVKNSKTASVSFAKGNHDDCSWYAFKNGLGDRGTISAKQWYTHAVNPIRTQYPIVLDEENKVGGYYYTDYPHLKVRVITLNTNDVPYVEGDDGNFKDNTVVGQWCLGVGERQLKWLCETLKFSESGWSVIVIAHSHPGDRALKNRELLAEILDAFKNRKKGTAESNEQYFEAKADYDFTENSSNDLLAYLCGHEHKDKLVEDFGFSIVVTKNLLGDWRSEDCSDDSNFDCMLIDKKKRKLIIKRFLKPQNDREIDLI